MKPGEDNAGTPKGIGLGNTDDEPNRPRKNYLLGIGINDYKHWEPLNNAVKDVQDVIALLQKHYQFDPKYTKMLLNEEATRDNIIMALEEYVDRLTPEDNLLIYYSGHGHLYGRMKKKGYWVPVDAQLRGTVDYLPNSRIKELLEDIDCHHLLLVSDACFSGSILYRGGTSPFAALDELDSRRSRWAICSGRHDEFVVDGLEGGNSPFASSILSVLQENKAAKLNVQKLIDQVMNLTHAYLGSEQLPQGNRLEGDKGGQFIFFRRIGESTSWDRARRENTIEAYQLYLKNFPNGDHAPEAEGRLEVLLEEAAWEKVQAEDSIAGYSAYLLKYGKGRYREAAMEQLYQKEDESAWERARNSKQLYMLHRYINNFPEGRHYQEALELAQNFEALREAEDVLSETPMSYSSTIRPEQIDNTKEVKLPDMVVVEKGRFEMGSNTFNRERPIHSVQLNSFRMAKYPATFAEYDLFCEMTKRRKPQDEGWGRGRRPVVNVSWYDAVAYCNWLSEMCGLEPVYKIGKDGATVEKANHAANGYRLPTEAEWEYAARGGQWSMGYPYPGGKELGGLAWYEHNSSGKTQPVGGKKANELGLFDMSGNCYEWVFDRWGYSYYQEFAGRIADNPTGPESGLHRVIRGGAYISDDDFCRVSYREDYHPELRKEFIGFRLAQNT